MLRYNMGHIHEKIDFSPERLTAVTELLEKHKKQLEEKNSQFLKINSQISVLDSQKEVPLKIQERITSLGDCPTCYQAVSSEHKSRITKKTQFEIEDIIRELEQKIQRRQILIQDIEKEKDLEKYLDEDYVLIGNKFLIIIIELI